MRAAREQPTTPRKPPQAFNYTHYKNKINKSRNLKKKKNRFLQATSLALSKTTLSWGILLQPTDTLRGLRGEPLDPAQEQHFCGQVPGGSPRSCIFLAGQGPLRASPTDFSTSPHSSPAARAPLPPPPAGNSQVEQNIRAGILRHPAGASGGDRQGSPRPPWGRGEQRGPQQGRRVYGERPGGTAPHGRANRRPPRPPPRYLRRAPAPARPAGPAPPAAGTRSPGCGPPCSRGGDGRSAPLAAPRSPFVRG